MAIAIGKDGCERRRADARDRVILAELEKKINAHSSQVKTEDRRVTR